jgi:sigma-B regulation protein RsbU (phosphoserine phosphatase)
MNVTELAGIAIACTLLALGAASTVAGAFRRRAADRLLLTFGSWCLLYGIRLAAQQPAIDRTIGGSSVAWAYVITSITYLINVPSGWFFEILIGPGWKQSVRRLWQLQAAYAVIAIAVDATVGQPGAAMAPNRPIVLAWLVVVVVNVVLYRRRLTRPFRTPIIAIGAAVLAFAVLNENLGRPVAPAVDLEPIGVLVFLAALGYGVVVNVFQSEAQLAAVQRELETASEIQRSLLPPALPTIDRLGMAVEYVPMASVAGDLYDFVRLAPTRLGVLVADVSGHGVPAALVASMVKLAFATQAESADDPALVLAGMNRVLARQLDRSFVTALYAVIDTERARVTVANAGHPPLLIGRASGILEEVTEHGMMMGFAPETSYRNAEVGLQPGDLMLLYTDGVTEVQNRLGEFFDVARVKQWLLTAGRRDPEAIRRLAFDELTRWRGGAGFEDDVTLVVAGLR